ncbi:MAG TPA: hypothetical protein VFU29_22150 [Chitinophagaceae bacterium]|nr:hypothetical protein [Chitinophagaceae bacterium]
MEVHHHSHTPGKKWTHYFWEFLMLFLAVFCGFLAEYQLEHKIEKNREKQFMLSMIDDLKADTNAIAALNRQRIVRLQMYDSLSKAIKEKTFSEKGADFYYWGRNISRRVFFFSADGTMQQLKNSGGLRLISDRNIADKIIAYDVLYRSIGIQQQLEDVELNEYRIIARKIFDAAIFYEMKRSSTRMVGNNPNLNSILEKPPGNPQLKDSSPASLNELGNTLNYWAVGSLRHFDLLEVLKKRAVELIDLIRNEYHLK